MAVTGCVFVCEKACDYWYGERKTKMLSAKFDGEGNKKAKKKKIRRERKRGIKPDHYLPAVFQSQNSGQH